MSQNIHFDPISADFENSEFFYQNETIFLEDQEHRKRLLEDHAHLESTVTNINTELENEKEKTRKTLKLAYLLRLEIAKVGFRRFHYRWLENSAGDRKSDLNFQPSKIEPHLSKTHLSKKL